MSSHLYIRFFSFVVLITGLLFGFYHAVSLTSLTALEQDEDVSGLRFPDEPPPEPNGYRMKEYRTIVPLTLAGAHVVSDKQAMQLYLEKKTIFVDVMPFVPRPPNLPKKMIWRDKQRKNIPGSVWLANVGYGRLPREMAQFFQQNLERLSKGDKTQPLLFYCQKDCWMSWNAAKRALELGYSSVSWYPLGTDGWVTIGGKVVDAKAVPLPDMTRPLKPSGN